MADKIQTDGQQVNLTFRQFLGQTMIYVDNVTRKFTSEITYQGNACWYQLVCILDCLIPGIYLDCPSVCPIRYSWEPELHPGCVHVGIPTPPDLSVLPHCLDHVMPGTIRGKMNRLSVYSYLTRFPYGHARSGRLFKSLPEKIGNPLHIQSEVADKTRNTHGRTHRQ